MPQATGSPSKLLPVLAGSGDSLGSLVVVKVGLLGQIRTQMGFFLGGGMLRAC